MPCYVIDDAQRALLFSLAIHVSHGVHVSFRSHFNKDIFYSRRFGSILCSVTALLYLWKCSISVHKFIRMFLYREFSRRSFNLNVSMSVCLFSCYAYCCDTVVYLFSFIYSGLKHMKILSNFTKHSVKLLSTQASNANARFIYIEISTYKHVDIRIIVKVLERDNSLGTLSLNKSQWFENLQLFFRCDSHFGAFHAVQMSMM